MSRANIAVVERILDAFNRRDLETALACAHPEITFRPVVAQALGRTEPFVGHEGLRQYYALTSELWDELQVEVAEIQQAGDSVVAIGTVHGRGPGGAVDASVIWTWKLRDGLIVEGRIHGDTAVARAALGLERAGEPEQSPERPRRGA